MEEEEEEEEVVNVAGHMRSVVTLSCENVQSFMLNFRLGGGD